jgi:hypothetical protein
MFSFYIEYTDLPYILSFLGRKMEKKGGKWREKEKLDIVNIL